MKFNVPTLPIENPLLRHLVWIGIIKIILIYSIWYAFLRGHATEVDAHSAAERIVSPLSNSNQTSEVNQQ